MRSPDRLAAAIVAAAAALAALGIWTPFARSLIPISLDGVVTHHHIKYEKHPGLDDVYLVRVDGGRRLVVDRVVGSQLGVGETVRKRAMSTTLSTDGGAVPLHLSDDARGMAVVMPSALIAVIAALRFGNAREKQ